MPLCCGRLSWMCSERTRRIDFLWDRRLLKAADSQQSRARRRFLRFMRGFDDDDLAILFRAVQSQGKDAKECALGPPMNDDPSELDNYSARTTIQAELISGQRPNGDGLGVIPQIDKPLSVPFLCCKLWRWRELHVDAALNRLDSLPWCRFGRMSVNGATVSCCNPYHYALWTKPESPIEQSAFISNGLLDSFTAKDTGFGDELSPTIERSPSSIPSVDVWARLARWELKERVGDLVSLVGSIVTVGQLVDAVHDTQNCLHDWDVRNEVGFALLRRPTADSQYEDVWLYNCGVRPLFCCMSTIDIADTSDAIRRVSPGYCLRVYQLYQSNRAAPQSRPRTNTNLTISHGKGWGYNYHRLYVTDCPCRFEVIFL